MKQFNTCTSNILVPIHTPNARAKTRVPSEMQPKNQKPSNHETTSTQYMRKMTPNAPFVFIVKFISYSTQGVADSPISIIPEYPLPLSPSMNGAKPA